MSMYKRIAWGMLVAAVVAFGTLGTAQAAGTGRHVIGDLEILSRIDQQCDQASADRQVIQTLLERKDVELIAGSVGVNLERARTSAAVLSGPKLEKLAQQAREVNARLAGGDEKVVISATALIIILLIIILIAN